MPQLSPRRARVCSALLLAVVLGGCGGAAPTASTASASVPAPSTSSAPLAPTPSAPASIASAFTSADTAQARLQQVVTGLRDKLGAPGALGLSVDGDTQVFASAGTADLAGKVAITPATRFRIASITKPIVAALVLTSVARGELALGDVVADVMPGVIRPTPKITVRQLLDHTSGVFDEGNDGDPIIDLERLSDPKMRADAKSLLSAAIAGKSVVVPARIIVGLAETHDRYFAPGAGYHYSNVNYQIAAMLLEHVTGRTLADLVRDRVVTPLGLQHTSIAPADRSSPDLRGYESRPGSPIDSTDDLAWFGNGANGGIVSTPAELLAMLRAVVTAKLFPQALVTDMETPNREHYGLGLASYDFTCGTFYGHGGSVSGTLSLAVIAPDGERGVVLAANLRGTGDPGLETRADAVLCGPG